MASSSTQPGGAASNKLILTPVTTLEGHEPFPSMFDEQEQQISSCINSICYFPDGEQMLSGSGDKTARRWDLRIGKEIEEARYVYEQEVWEVAVSKDGRWVVHVTMHDVYDQWELKVCEVETGIVRTFESHSDLAIFGIDICADSTLLAAGSRGNSVWIWSMDTGKVVAGPFKSDHSVGAVRLSQNSKKLAIKSELTEALEVWDIETQTLDVRRVGKYHHALRYVTYTPVLWTVKDKSIVTASAAFTFTVSHQPQPRTIYVFDALTLEIVGAPFEGHTYAINDLSLSLDGALLASASHDHTIKLWNFESRQLLASFDVHNLYTLVLSPNSHQLAYTIVDEAKIYICDIPPHILSSVWPGRPEEPSTNASKNPLLADLLTSDATRRAVRRNPIRLPTVTLPLRDSPTIPPQRAFLHYLRKFLPSRTNAVPPIQTDQRCDPLDFPATSPLPHNYPPAQVGRSHSDPRDNSRLPTTQSSATASTMFRARPYHLSTWWPIRAGHASPPIVNVPLAQGKQRNAAAGAPGPDDDTIRDEDYVPSTPPSPNPNSQQPSAAAQIHTGEHGSRRLCFCL